MRMGLSDSVRLWLAQWMARRQGRDPGEVLLDRRRVYILPTVPGVVSAAALLVMLIGSINYGLQLGFLLTFLVGSMSVAGMYHTHRNLARIAVRAHGVAPVFAGDVAAFEFTVRNTSPEARYALNFAFLLPSRRADGRPTRRERPTAGTTVDLPAGSTIRVAVALPTRRRGLRPCPRLRISTRFPLGLWRAWSYVTPELQAMVYPAPEVDAPPLPAGAGGTRESGQLALAGGDEFAGIRPYQAGDPQKTIAWRLAARSDDLSVRLFDSPAGGDLHLDFDGLAPLNVEARLSRIARWILMAEAAQRRYALDLPGARQPADIGPAHRQRCLEALATYPGAD